MAKQEVLPLPLMLLQRSHPDETRTQPATQALLRCTALWLLPELASTRTESQKPCTVVCTAESAL